MVVVEAVAPVVFADEFTDFVETGNVKYVFGKYFKKLKWDSFLQDLRGFIYFN